MSFTVGVRLKETGIIQKYVVDDVPDFEAARDFVRAEVGKHGVQLNPVLVGIKGGKS